ncbi:MAG: cysteine--tRNA ligase [Pseudomonadales bacterium]|nr:cysteine--tRNA ligase [Pseudomonadales bacterium]
MTLHIYNTLTRRKEPFRPIEPGRIRMYVCGITVYDLCHIGHARVLVCFDAIVRYLRTRGWDVTYVRNITDIDDKILNRAAENGEPFTALTARMIEAMHQDERALAVLPPDIEPRATAHIEDILDMVATLVDNHYAYLATNGDVYYRVKRFPDYGKLSGRNPDELLAGARVDPDEAKEDPRDFALWKAAAADEVGWDSPWGRGRPGWHIECSAMSTCHLGETFDIHGGGPDLPFPHHENEIAQSEAATGKTYVHWWMHAGPVRVDDEKMSKSLGNFFTIREVLARYHPEVVRYFLLSSHYRSPINYSEDNLREAKAALDGLYFALRGHTAGVTPPADVFASPWGQRFAAAMDDDFNTREAIAVLQELSGQINQRGREGGEIQSLVSELLGLGALLGLVQQDPDHYFQGGGVITGYGPDVVVEARGAVYNEEYIDQLIAERNQARAARDFGRADAIRDELKGVGIVLEDSGGETRWRRE